MIRAALIKTSKSIIGEIEVRCLCSLLLSIIIRDSLNVKVVVISIFVLNSLLDFAPSSLLKDGSFKREPSQNYLPERP